MEMEVPLPEEGVKECWQAIPSVKRSFRAIFSQLLSQEKRPDLVRGPAVDTTNKLAD